MTGSNIASGELAPSNSRRSHLISVPSKSPRRWSRLPKAAVAGSLQAAPTYASRSSRRAWADSRPTLGRFDPAHCLDPVDRSIERCHDANASCLRLRDKIRLCVVDSVHFIDLEGAQQSRQVDHSKRRVGQGRPDQRDQSGPIEFVKRLEDEQSLSDDQVREQQPPSARKQLGRAPRQIGWVAG